MSSAEKLEFVIGVALFVGLGIATCVCVVKGVSTRSRAWIVAGYLTGGLFALLVSLPIYWVIDGFMSAKREHEGRLASRKQAGADSQIVRGKDISYSIRVPSDWTLRTSKPDFEFVAKRRSLYVGVIAEEASFGSPEAIVELKRKQITEQDANVRFTDATPIIIDGQTWLALEVHSGLSNLPFSYQFYVYSGQKGTFQVVGWTSHELFKRDALLMRQVMQTFRFPE